MTLLICLIVIIPLVVLLSKPIKKYPINFYLGSLVVGLLLLIVPQLIGFPLLNQRYIGLSLLIIVMFTGVLNRKQSAVKPLLSIRGELAIMGFIFVSFHALKHLLNDQTYPLVWVFGFISYLILLPLTLTSFKKIKKWVGRKWKHIHTLSYLFYLTIFIHIYLAASLYNQIIYLSLFMLYSVLKFIRIGINIKEQKKQLAPTIHS
jgi:DMSO/TMAO reductase YedYZ heme-binding membrane subunit